LILEIQFFWDHFLKRLLSPLCHHVIFVEIPLTAYVMVYFCAIYLFPWFICLYLYN
jgi:hypothetical protein